MLLELSKSNKETFGDIFANVKKAEETIIVVENRTLVDMSEEAHIGLQWAKAELKNVLAVEE